MPKSTRFRFLESGIDAQSRLGQQTYLHALLTSSISTASLVPITLHPLSSP
jgi:hypothetical protein